MKKLSSNNLEMDANLNLLSTIKKLDVPEYLLEKIGRKIMERRIPNIKPQWAIGIAASILLVIGIEIIGIKNRIDNEKRQVVENMLPTQKYDIYE